MAPFPFEWRAFIPFALVGVAFPVLFLCFSREMPRKTRTITPQQFGEFERLRRAVVSKNWSDERLKGDFGLSPKLATFAREYALSGCTKNAAIYAGFQKKTAEKGASRFIKRCSKAIAAIRHDLELSGDSFKAGLNEYLAGCLLDVAEMRREFPGAAVLAVKELREMFLFDFNPAADDKQRKALIDLEAIENEARLLGVYEAPDGETA